MTAQLWVQFMYMLSADVANDEQARSWTKEVIQTVCGEYHLVGDDLLEVIEKQLMYPGQGKLDLTSGCESHLLGYFCSILSISRFTRGS